MKPNLSDRFRLVEKFFQGEAAAQASEGRTQSMNATKKENNGSTGCGTLIRRSRMDIKHF
jgi:hypothetical protein